MKIVELVREDAPVQEIADVISTDSALAAKLLKTANSTFYRRSHSVSTIKHATTILGLQALRTLVLGFSLVHRLKMARPGPSTTKNTGDAVCIPQPPRAPWR